MTARTRDYILGNALAVLTVLVIAGLAVMYLTGMTPAELWSGL